MPDSHHGGHSEDLPSHVEDAMPPPCGAGSSVGTVSGGSKSSEDTSTASVSFYTSVDAASRTVVQGTSAGQAVSHALAQLGQEDSILQSAGDVIA